jgi:zinc transporter ZupT
MVWMVLGELLPEALETAPAKVVALACGTAFALMLGFQLLLS